MRSPAIIDRPAPLALAQRSARRARVGSVSILGDVSILGTVQVLGEPIEPVVDVPTIDRIGWYWDRAGNCLVAYVTTPDGVSSVRVPMGRVWQAFQAAARSHGYELDPIVSGACTVDGLFSRVKNAVKKVVPKPIQRPIQAIAKTAQQRLVPVVRAAERVGRGAIKVGSHPAFGAVMGALAVTPPLTAVGGAGLAAYAAAKTAQRVVSAADAARAGVRALGPAAAAAARNPSAAGRAVQTIGRNVQQMRSSPAQSSRLLGAALRSIG